MVFTIRTRRRFRPPHSSTLLPVVGGLLAMGFAVPAVPAHDAATGLSVEQFHVADEQERALIERLLADNPQVRAAWARWRSGHARVDQARSLPDPQLMYRYFATTPETRVGPQEHMLEVSQGVPWGGKRALSARRAESLATALTWEAEDLQRQLVAQLKRAYAHAAFLQEAITVNAEERALLQRFESIALRRYSTGQGIQQSAVKVQTEISRLGDRDTELRQQLDVASRHIAHLVGEPEAPLALAPIRLALPELDEELEQLEQLALAEHPRVHAVEQRIEGDRAWARRQSLERRPDFRFGLGYTVVDRRQDPAGIANPPQDNGKDVVALTAGINIPLWRKRIRAGVTEARESERAHGELLEAVRDRLRFDLQEAWLRLEALDERARLYRDVIIPQAEESLGSAEAAYTTDRLRFLDLLDAERVLFQSRLTFHRLVSDLWMALADLELAAGRPFPGRARPAGPPGAEPGAPS